MVLTLFGRVAHLFLVLTFFPWQPDPAALLHIAQHWGIEPSELVMVGDSAKDDVRRIDDSSSNPGLALALTIVLMITCRS